MCVVVQWSMSKITGRDGRTCTGALSECQKQKKSAFQIFVRSSSETLLRESQVVRACRPCSLVCQSTDPSALANLQLALSSAAALTASSGFFIFLAFLAGGPSVAISFSDNSHNGDHSKGNELEVVLDPWSVQVARFTFS